MCDTFVCLTTTLKFCDFTGLLALSSYKHNCIEDTVWKGQKEGKGGGGRRGGVMVGVLSIVFIIYFTVTVCGNCIHIVLKY